MLSNRGPRIVFAFAFVFLALHPGPDRALARNDIAQWDLDGTLQSTTGQDQLFEEGTPSLQFETVDINGSPADVAHLLRGTYLRVTHGFPGNGGGVYVNQYTLVMDVMFPDRSPSGGWASLLQTNCCNGNDGDWFVDPSGGLGINGNFSGSIQDGTWYRVALVVDLVEGSYTSYVDGVQVQQNVRPAADLELDGRFSLYDPTDPDPENFFFIFADDNGQDAEVYVNSVQFRDKPLPPSEIEKLGGPSADGIPKPNLVVERQLPVSIAGGQTFPVTLDLSTFVSYTTATIRERIPRFWTASNPSPPGRIEVDAGGRQTLIWEFTGGVADQSFGYSLTAPNPYARVSFVGGGVVADGEQFGITGDTRIRDGSEGFVAEALVISMKQTTTACAGASIGNAAQAQDFLTNGDDVTESTVAPAQGEAVAPDFLHASPSPGPSGPSSLLWAHMTGPVFLPSSCDDCMGYVAYYAENTTGGVLRVSAASASDDGEQILVDGREVWNHSVPRGSGVAQVQDRSPLFDLAPGKHLVMQKIFEGCGSFDGAMRFEDEDQNPLTGPIPGGPVVFSLNPDGYEPARAFVLRDIPDTLDVGETGVVTLKLRPKVALNDATIEETYPAAFSVSGISDGGVQDAASHKITWSIAGPLARKDLTYRLSIPEGAADAPFQGTATLGGRSGPILGDVEFARGAMNEAGFIKRWLVFGPLDTAGLWPGDPANPPADSNGTSATPENGDLRADYLTDGVTTEANIRPFDGMRYLPNFGPSGPAKSLGLKPVPRTDCAPATPTWESFISRSGTFNHNDYFGGEVDAHATYAACYLTNPGPASLQTNIAFDSDDAFIAFLDGAEIGAYEPPPCSELAPPAGNGCGRGMGAEGTVVNTFPVTIPAGEHFLLTRVHDGFGGSGSRVRFQDGAGNPVLPPAITASALSKSSPPAAYVHRILSSTAYQVGKDPIVVTIRVESSGTHGVAISERLPADWSATGISDGGTLSAGRIDWTLSGVTGVKEVTYKLEPGQCPGDGKFCGNGTDASEYAVDGGAKQALDGDSTFSRNNRGTDDLGSWDARDLGYTGGGTQLFDPHGVDVMGQGQGVNLKKKDEARVVSIPATGDFEISAMIECMDDIGQAGQGGIMVRGDTAYGADAAMAVVCLTSLAPATGGGIGTLSQISRLKPAQNSGVKVLSADQKNVDSLPIWLKVKRSIDPVNHWSVLSFQRSSDGVGYTEIATRDVLQAGATGQTSPITLPDTVLIGLSVTGGGGGSTVVSFRDVTGNIGGVALPDFNASPTTPNAPTNLVATARDRRVDLTWSDPAGGAPFSGFEVVRDGASWAGVPSSLHSYSDIGLTDGTQYCYVVRATSGALKSADSNQECATPTGGEQPVFKRGDVDGTGVVELTDVINLIGFLFLGNPPNLACFDAADLDDTGIVELTDAIVGIGWLFLGNPTSLPAPGPFACGADANADTLPACTSVCQ
jgi:hypothetical protein